MKVAAIQTASRFGDTEYNVNRAVGLARDAADQGARLMAFPEFFACGSVTEALDPSTFLLAERVDGPTITRMSEASRDLGVWMCVPLFEHDQDASGAYFNAVLMLNPAGNVIAQYRKRFLPNRRANEKYLFSPGNLPSPVWDADEARFGINICFERQFVETARIPALKGADVLVHVSHTWGTGFGGVVETWAQQAAGMARLNSIWVLAACAAHLPGQPGPGGQSLLVDPRGKLVTMLNDEEGILVCEIDANDARETRRKARMLVEQRVDVLEEMAALTQELRVLS
jgi:N-carbamoylputrescine amidase